MVEMAQTELLIVPYGIETHSAETVFQLSGRF